MIERQKEEELVEFQREIEAAKRKNKKRTKNQHELEFEDARKRQMKPICDDISKQKKEVKGLYNSTKESLERIHHFLNFDSNWELDFQKMVRPISPKSLIPEFDSWKPPRAGIHHQSKNEEKPKQNGTFFKK